MRLVGSSARFSSHSLTAMASVPSRAYTSATVHSGTVMPSIAAAGGCGGTHDRAVLNGQGRFDDAA